MRKIILVLLWSLVPVAAFAGTPAAPNVPEPEILSLLGLGALGFLTSRFIKK